MPQIITEYLPSVNELILAVGEAIAQGMAQHQLRRKTLEKRKIVFLKPTAKESWILQDFVLTLI
jgi:hypothetical protein